MNEDSLGWSYDVFAGTAWNVVTVLIDGATAFQIKGLSTHAVIAWSVQQYSLASVGSDAQTQWCCAVPSETAHALCISIHGLN
jgi:hypothetical protein